MTGRFAKVTGKVSSKAIRSSSKALAGKTISKSRFAKVTGGVSSKASTPASKALAGKKIAKSRFAKVTGGVSSKACPPISKALAGKKITKSRPAKVTRIGPSKASSPTPKRPARKGIIEPKDATVGPKAGIKLQRGTRPSPVAQVYVLQLEDGFVYVGKSSNVQRRYAHLLDAKDTTAMPYRSSPLL